MRYIIGLNKVDIRIKWYKTCVKILTLQNLLKVALGLRIGVYCAGWIESCLRVALFLSSLIT